VFQTPQARSTYCAAMRCVHGMKSMYFQDCLLSFNISIFTLERRVRPADRRVVLPPTTHGQCRPALHVGSEESYCLEAPRNPGELDATGCCLISDGMWAEKVRLNIQTTPDSFCRRCRFVCTSGMAFPGNGYWGEMHSVKKGRGFCRKQECVNTCGSP